MTLPPPGDGADPDRDPLVNQREIDRLFSLTYEELRRLAAGVRRRDGSATLSPSTLVNEAWLKLSKADRLELTSPLHFKRLAARAMRQVLIEAARRRRAEKRGGREVVQVTFDEELHLADSPENVLALNAALEELERVSPRQAQIVECRFFGGLNIAEAAELLQLSEATIQRDWRSARAWLVQALGNPD